MLFVVRKKNTRSGELDEEYKNNKLLRGQLGRMGTGKPNLKESRKCGSGRWE